MFSEKQKKAVADLPPEQVFSRKEIAEVLGESEQRVQDRWDAWGTTDEGRLQSLLQTGRKSGRMSSRQHLLDMIARGG